MEVGLRGEERRGRREGRGAASVAAAFLSLLFRRVEHEVEDDLVSSFFFLLNGQAKRAVVWVKERGKRLREEPLCFPFFFLFTKGR